MKDIGQKGAVFGEYFKSIVPKVIYVSLFLFNALCPVIASYIK